MKYASVFLVLLFAWWIWRKNRRSGAPPVERAPKPQAPQAADGQLMLQCAHCGVHLPSSEAIHGKRLAYCSLAHKAKAQD